MSPRKNKDNGVTILPVVNKGSGPTAAPLRQNEPFRFHLVVIRSYGMSLSEDTIRGNFIFFKCWVTKVWVSANYLLTRNCLAGLGCVQLQARRGSFSMTQRLAQPPVTRMPR